MIRQALARLGQMIPLPPLPRWLKFALVIAVVASWLPFALIARTRAVRSEVPRPVVFLDMDRQPKFRPQDPNAMFADARAMRPQPAGTVARGQLRADDRLYTGQENGEWITDYPLNVDERFVRRGQERFNIYCATCHGLTGAGNGPTHQRAVKLGEPKWIPPTSLLSQPVRERPNGHLFNTITHGIRNMPPYAAQIEVPDRWAIVAYVRALQLSRDAGLEDVPAEQRATLK